MPLDPVVALEIGTAKVIALVGEMREDGHIMVTGMGEVPSQGVSKGEVTDLEAATDAVRAALTGAEESGKVAIREVYLVVSGGHIQSLVNRGVVPVLDADGEITRDDIDKVMDVARAVNLPAECEVLHTVCQHFMIDDRQRVVQPEGMEGARLALNMMVLHGVRTSLRNTIKVAETVPVDVSDVAFGGLCSALAVLTAEQKKGGALVIDLGAGTSEYLAYAGGVIAAAGVVGVGGDHVTNDVALAFGIPMRQAETCKRDAGCVLPGGDAGDQKLSAPPGGGFAGRSVPLRSLVTVIRARMEETFDMVRRRVDAEGVLGHLGAGVILVGGGAHLAGVTDLASEMFGVPCLVGRPRGVSGLATATEGPQYAACSGLVQYGFRMVTSRRRARPLAGWLKGLLGR